MNLLRFDDKTPLPLLKEAVVETGRIAYHQGLMLANDGNISLRMPDGNILITPSGICKGRMQVSDLLVVDLDGEVTQRAADPNLKPTSEQPMHLEVYRRRPDVRAVLHAHPPHAVALTVAGRDIRTDFLLEGIVALGEVPVTEFALPSSEENAAVIRNLILDHDILMIRNHGSLTVGKDLEEAQIHLERLEQVAKIQIWAELLGKINPVPADLLPRLYQMRADYIKK